MMHRFALQEISATPLSMRLADTVNNSYMIPDSYLTPSPEEQIIQQRSRRSSLEDSPGSDGQATPPRTLYTAHNTRKRLVLTPADSPIKSYGKRPRYQRKVPTIPLDLELQGYSHSQLVKAIDHIVNNHPELEEEVRILLPAPDLKPLKERLTTQHHNVYKAFPSTRWASSRDAYAYRRVKGQLGVFKKVCAEQGKLLVHAQCWEAVIKYSLMAWKIVHQLPTWDESSHNTSKTQCFRTLASQCLMALKKATFEKEKYRDIKESLLVAMKLNAELSPCLHLVEKCLESLP